MPNTLASHHLVTQDMSLIAEEVLETISLTVENFLILNIYTL